MNKKFLLGIIIVLIGCGLLFQNVIRTFTGSSAFGTTETSSSYDASNIKTLNIHSSSVSLTVAPTNDDEIKLALSKRGFGKASLEKHVTVQQHDDELQIQITGNKFAFFWLFNRGFTAELLVPQKMYDQFNVASKSGNVTVQNVQAANLDVSSKSGNITIKEGAGEQFSVKSTSGNIKLNDIEATNFSAKATSGNVTLDQVDSDLISLAVTSGNVKLDSFTAEKIDASVTSGNVNIKRGASAFHVKTTSGNINIEADEIAGDSTLAASSGNVKLTLNKRPQSLFVSHKKSSGSTEIKYNDFKTSSYSDKNKKVEGQFGDGDIKLEVVTTSGNFKLQ